MVEFSPAIPIFRLFDEEKAREFYLSFLCFDVDFEHWYSDDAPLYLGVSRDCFELHLSEHHGDGTPERAYACRSAISRNSMPNCRPGTTGSTSPPLLIRIGATAN